MSNSLKVVVIGAGLSGLIAARELQRESHEVVILEKSHRLGGIWIYDPRVESDLLGLDPNREIVHASIYKSLRTNSPRAIMGFSDFPFKGKVYGDPRTFPGHKEVLSYLEDFAKTFEVDKLIRFNTEVTRVELLDSESTEFVVESKVSGVGLKEVFDAVVICNGHNTQPKVACDIPGIIKWHKKQLHSHNYRIPGPYRDQVVVIIGDGSSAFDISRDIATVAKEVHLSSRSPHIKVSKLENYNNIWQHSKIDRVLKDGIIVFHDEKVFVKTDVIVHCTGYNFHIPFLKMNDIVNVNDKYVAPVYEHVFLPQLAPRLSFVGLNHMGMTFRPAELQSKWIAQALSGKILLPSKKEMLNDIEEHYQQMEENGIPKSHIHSLDYKMDYLDWLSTQLGIASPPQELKELYARFIERYRFDREGFRDTFKDDFSSY